MTTKVIFKKFPSIDGINDPIIACFPELAGNIFAVDCLSYQHLGQHGAAGAKYMASLDPATPAEYQDLLQELVSIGYDDLVIAKKFTYKDYLKRQEQIK